MPKSVPFLVIASANTSKAREIAEFLKGAPVKVTLLRDAKDILQDVESVDDYEGNAAAKAMTAAKSEGRMALGEDSGLEVDFLDGRPGPLSARYISETAGAGEKNEALLNELKDVPTDKRSARFVSVIAVADPGGNVEIFRGECKGHIADEIKGTYGFGYDPIFVPEGKDKTFGELGGKVKSAMSHRANAMAKVRDHFKAKDC